MRTSVIITSAFAAGALAAPQRVARNIPGLSIPGLNLPGLTNGACKADSCLDKLLQHLQISPDFCSKFTVGACGNEIEGEMDWAVQSACSCASSTATASVPSGPAPTSIAVHTTVPSVPKPDTTPKVPVPQITSPAVAATSVRKCKGKGASSTPAVATPPSTPVATSVSASVPATQPTPLSSSPGGGVSPDTCPVPVLSGGDFNIVGELGQNAGMWLQSNSGSCGAKVFDLAKETGWSAEGKASFASLRRRDLLSGLNLSGSLASLVGESKNFLQITGRAQSACQSVCQKVSLCKGQQYTMSIGGACDMGPDALLQFTAGATGGATGQLSSEIKHLTGGHSLGGAFEWTFTWDGVTGLVDLCALTTIVEELQSVGLWNFGITSV